MTGRDLIIYILKHNLENEEVLKDGMFVGFITDKEVAVKFDVGVETVRAWYRLGMVKGFRIDDDLYFMKDIEDPRQSF